VGSNQPLQHELILIARELGYKKIDRLNCRLEELEENNKGSSWETANYVLSSAINDVYALLFLPNRMIQITPYGTQFSIALRGYRNADNYLLIHPCLNENFLRRAFTGFEFVVFKLCQLYFENNRHDYRWETESTRVRMKKLVPVVAPASQLDYTELFDNIFYVRDAFAHTFIEIEQIRYAGTQLEECFGYAYTGSHLDAAKATFTFVEDLNSLFKPIMLMFMKQQYGQIDKNKFYKLCDRLVIRRSLAPGHD
jgi:hypothetical protein